MKVCSNCDSEFRAANSGHSTFIHPSDKHIGVILWCPYCGHTWAIGKLDIADMESNTLETSKRS